MNPVFTIENMRPIRGGMTVSRDSRLGTVNKITYFSMGAGTSISQESYDRMTMYITNAGSGTFLLGAEHFFWVKNRKMFLPPPARHSLSLKRLCAVCRQKTDWYTLKLFLKRRTL